MSVYTDPIGHQVDVYFLGRRLEQSAANTNQPDNTTTSGR